MIQLARTDALYQQIASHFEREIAEGRLASGDRLPTTKELAAQFKVNTDTIQQSLKVLVNRGLVERAPGRGTYVRHGISSKTVGIIFGKEIYTDPDMMFFSTFLDALTECMEEKGWNCRLYASSDLASYDKAFYDLKSAVEAGEVRAVIEFCSNDLIRDWLDNECPVPRSTNSLNVDFHDFTLNGLNYLHQHGARNIAVMAYKTDKGVGEFETAIAQFQQSHGDLPAIEMITTKSHAENGYEAACRLLQESPNIDGLLVANDGAFRGVLYALLQQGIAFPDDLKFITYANKDVEIFSHIPVTKLEVNPQAFAEQAYEEITARIEGRKVVSTPVKPKLVAGKTCGE